MDIGKKSMYFTIMTLLFLGVFVFAFLIPSFQRQSEKMEVIELRVYAMNDFLKDLERDVERGLYISSYRSLMSLVDYIMKSHDFIENATIRFEEALLNGTVYNQPTVLMTASTFPNWTKNIAMKASSLNINATIFVNSVEAYQDDPWNVKVRANLTFLLSDVTDISSWVRNVSIVTSVPITNFEDPFYIVFAYSYTYDTLTLIRRTPTEFEGKYITWIPGPDYWNASAFVTHINESFYTEHEDAPSFIMRLEGNISTTAPGITHESACCGIESMVHLKRLEQIPAGLRPVYPLASVIDHNYWADNGTLPRAVLYSNVSTKLPWAKIDQYHWVKYTINHGNSLELP